MNGNTENRSKGEFAKGVKIEFEHYLPNWDKVNETEYKLNYIENLDRVLKEMVAKEERQLQNIKRFAIGTDGPLTSSATDFPGLNDRLFYFN